MKKVTLAITTLEKIRGRSQNIEFKVDLKEQTLSQIKQKKYYRV